MRIKSQNHIYGYVDVYLYVCAYLLKGLYNACDIHTILSREELDQIYQVGLSPPNVAGLQDKHINR